MMIDEEPYFMKNREWYWKIPGKSGYKLTDKAPQKAKESYKWFYNFDLDLYDDVPEMTDEMVEAGIQEYKKLVAEGKLPPQDD